MQKTAFTPALALATALAFALPGVAVAKSEKPNPTSECLAAATTEAEKQACIGLWAESCRKKLRSPQVTDLAMCNNTEIGWWRKRLAEAEAAMAQRAAERDAPFEKAISEGASTMAEDLKLMTAAWNTWREHRCNFESMFYRGSPRRMLHAQECHLQLTAEQVLMLEEAAAR